MHLLQAQGGSPLDADEAIDLGQSPGDVIVLSAADTELSALALATEHLPDDGTRLRIANLGMLKHPYSVDLYVENVCADAKLIVVRALGGQSYWQYLIEQVVLSAQASRAKVALLPGDDKPDPELAALSTVDPALYDHLWQCLNQGGPENSATFWQSAMAGVIQGDVVEMPLRGVWDLGPSPNGPTVWVTFYRALLMSGDTAPIESLVHALRAKGLNAKAFFMDSLKMADGRAAFESAIAAAGKPAAIVTTTAFTVSKASEMDAGGYFAQFDVPVVQTVLGSSTREQWQDGTAGLAARDIVMNAALPELDGRLLSRAISFKSPAKRIERVEWDVVRHEPVEDRVRYVSEVINTLETLKNFKRENKCVALVLANYPNKDGRMANGVGLDTPASALKIWEALSNDGWNVGDIPADGDTLMRGLSDGTTNAKQVKSAGLTWSFSAYEARFKQLPQATQDAVISRWGDPNDDPFFDTDALAFQLPLHRHENLLIGIQPARGYNIDPEASYHDPDLPPPHGYLAFYMVLKQHVHAVVHVGKHGNLEWLPGKGIALSDQCFPDAILDGLPNFYPFIVNDPGEGTQAKRRTHATIIDHMTPPLTRAEGYGALAELERQVDEYFQASGLDPRRLKMLKKGILDDVRALGLDGDAGITDADSEEDALGKLDNHLCALKELQIRDGLHILGAAPVGDQRRDLLSALVRLPRGDGKGVNASLQQAIADAFALPIKVLDCTYSDTWEGTRPDVLAAMDDAPWRTVGDTVERVELFALALLDGQTQAPQAPSDDVAALVDEAQTRLGGLLDQSASNELANLLNGLNGGFVPPGPSGAPTRGRLDIFPTGRNFFSVDSRALPTPAAWTLGKKSAERLVQRYRQDHGKWPSAMLLSMWGTANMRTGGDDIAQALALMGVQPTWDAQGTGRVTGVELLPLSMLGRPRVDLTMRVSGFFRDAFPAQIELLDKAVKLAAAATDEPPKQNPIAARVAEDIALGTSEAAATRRVFGSMPGAYGAGLQALIDEKGWQSQEDLATAYIKWGNFAYGGGAEGASDEGGFIKRLAATEAVVHNQDNQEHDILDSDDYYQFEGGAAAAVKMARIEDGLEGPAIYHNDHSRPENPMPRSLREEMGRIVRGRAANPKWIAGVMRHGYKGAFEIAATVDYMFAFSATTDAVANQHYDALYTAYVEDQAVQDFMEQSNPAARREMAQRFLEAIDRGLWQPTRNAAYDTLQNILRDE